MSALPVTTRALESDDYAAWRALFGDYATFYKTALDDSVYEVLWGWLLEPRIPISGLVAESEGQIVGFAHLQQQRDTFTASTSWFLDDLFVAPEHRSRGIARMLIAQVKRFSSEHGGGRIRWITDAENHTARRLYDDVAQLTHWVMYEQGQDTA